MKQIVAGRSAIVSTYNQFKIKVELDLTKDDLKRNLYHLVKENESWVWEYLEKLSEKLDQK